MANLFYFSAGTSTVLDWSKRQSFSTPFTAPKNGVAFISLHVGSGLTGLSAYYWYVNGNITVSIQHISGYCAVFTSTVPLNKGDVLTTSNPGYVYQALFVPYK